MSHWTWIQWTVAAWFVVSIASQPMAIGTVRTKEMLSFGIIKIVVLACLLALGGFW